MTPPNLGRSQLLLTLILVSSVGLCRSIGTLDFGEDCDHAQSFSLQETKRCDSVRGLHCSPNRAECRCFVPGAYYQRGKCRAKVNRACGLADGFNVDCVKGALCNSMGTCHCVPGSMPNEEGSACHTDNGGRSSSRTSIPIIYYCVLAFMSIVFGAKGFSIL